MAANFNNLLVSYNAVKNPTFNVPTIPSFGEYYPAVTTTRSDTNNTPQQFRWHYTPTQTVSQSTASNTGDIKYNGQTRKVNDIVSTLQSNANNLNFKQTGKGKHTCTRAVVHALTGQTNYNTPSGVSDPGALYNKLSQQGWTDVLNDSYTPQAGDVYTIWGLGSKWGMHSSMYDGKNWSSYTSEGSTPYYWQKKNNPGAQVHIMRYVNKSKNGGVIWHH